MIHEYPQLREWLDKHRATCTWQRPGPGGADIEHWKINGHMVIVMLYPKRHGWDLFTQVGGNTTIICETLAEAEAKLGLSGSPHGTPLIYVVRSEVERWSDGIMEIDSWHVAAFTPEEATRIVREKIERALTPPAGPNLIKLISVSATNETVRRVPR